MTMEQLASQWQRDFESIRNEMASREELRATERTILRAIDGLGVQLAAHAARWNGEYERISDRVDDLGQRVTRIEQSVRE